MHSAKNKGDDSIVSSLLLLLQPLPADVQRAFLGHFSWPYRLAITGTINIKNPNLSGWGFRILVGPHGLEPWTKGL